MYSTQPTADGYAGDQTLLAPAFVASDAELDEIVERLAATVAAVEAQVKAELRPAPALRAREGRAGAAYDAGMATTSRDQLIALALRLIDGGRAGAG